MNNQKKTTITRDQKIAIEWLLKDDDANHSGWEKHEIIRAHSFDNNSWSDLAKPLNGMDLDTLTAILYDDHETKQVCDNVNKTITITQEQSDEIKEIENYSEALDNHSYINSNKAIAELTTGELAHILYTGNYKVQKVFELNDWVYDERSTETFKIETDMDLKTVLRDSKYHRYATKPEIVQAELGASKRKSKASITNFYFVLKRRTGKRNFLEDVWEEHDNLVDNFSFTDDLSKAMRFDNVYDVPKYLWDDLKGKSVETIEELCNFFNAELVLIEYSQNWEEV